MVTIPTVVESQGLQQHTMVQAQERLQAVAKTVTNVVNLGILKETAQSSRTRK